MVAVRSETKAVEPEEPSGYPCTFVQVAQRFHLQYESGRSRSLSQLDSPNAVDGCCRQLASDLLACIQVVSR